LKAKNQKKELRKNEQISRMLSSGEISEILGKGKLKNLFAATDISSIVFFRIIFGIFMFIEVLRYYSKIETYWLIPKHHFAYLPFDFITPLPGNGMFILFGIMLVLTIFIIFGFKYSFSIISFFICFTYVFLLEQTRYLNHFYLIVLVSFVMIFIPANTSASIDSKINREKQSETISLWSLWLLRFMIALPYFFGGIAKINSDWLQGEPFGSWFLNNIHIGSFNGILQQKTVIILMSYLSLIFDLAIIPMLLFRKTRTLGFLIAIAFHLINSQMFNIGIFPWFMIFATTIFFEPNWTRRFIQSFGNSIWPVSISSKKNLTSEDKLNIHQKRTMTFLFVWIIIMVIIPLRHILIPGNVNWTEEGQKFSWFMKLRTKDEIASFTVLDKKTGNVLPLNVYDHILPWQKNIMQDKPNLIWQFCHFVKDDYRKKGIDVSVYANVKASLNGRKYQQLTDSTVDIASLPFDYFTHSSWILQLEVPLSDHLEKASGNIGRNSSE
jgi:vitamin K-dependent gamma-carboxylase